MTSDACRTCTQCNKRKFLSGFPDKPEDKNEVCKMCVNKKRKPGNYTVHG